MDTRQLGNSDLQLSEFGIGTMTFGHEATRDESHEILDEYYAAGGRFIDTADVYTRGESERIIGEWLAERGVRDDLIIATKGRFPMGEGRSGTSRSYLPEAARASAERLGVETIDLYQLHGWDPDTPILETLETVHSLVETGLIRHFGVSNYTGFQLQKAIRLADQHGLTLPASLQPQYSLLARQIEWELLPQCLEENVGILPWGPLGGGWLTGKYQSATPPPTESRLGDNPNRGLEGLKHRDNHRTFEIVGAVEQIATGRGVSPAQVALNWVRQRPGVTSVLLGARNTTQLQDNLAALSWELSDAERDQLTLTSAPGIAIYPYGFIENYCSYKAWEELGTRAQPHDI